MAVKRRVIVAGRCVAANEVRYKATVSAAAGTGVPTPISIRAESDCASGSIAAQEQISEAEAAAVTILRELRKEIITGLDPVQDFMRRLGWSQSTALVNPAAIPT